MTLRYGILTIGTWDSFFPSSCFSGQNGMLSATEQNLTYNHSFFFRRPPTIVHNYSVRRYSHREIFIPMKTIDFWTIPSSSNPNTNFLLEPNSRKAEISYIIQCDVGASKNAEQAFSTKRLSSHCIIYEISAFRLFSPSN